MDYKKKSIIVKLGIVIVIISSSLLNGHLQMNKKANQVEKIFMEGDDEYHLSIHYDLEKIDDTLSYTISLAKANQQESNQYIKKIQTLHKEFSTLKDIDDFSVWYQNIKDIFPLAISYLESVQLSKEHRGMLAKYKATYNSATHTIAYSSYNDYVREYEKETDGIIAGFVKKVTNVKKVKTFD